MKLYYKPDACSQAVHIALLEVNAAHTLELVDTVAQRTESGENFREVNSNGYVPVLALEQGEFLSEGPAILQYIADTHPEWHLAPEPRTVQRAHFNALLNFLSAELHKAFAPFFYEAPLEGETRAQAKGVVRKKLAYLERILSDGRSFLSGEKFSVADAFAVVLVSWARPSGIELDEFPRLAAFQKRVGERESVRKARRVEARRSKAA